MEEKEKKDVLAQERLLLQRGNLEHRIKNLIYTVRDRHVMIDSDLAMLYQVET